MALTLLVAGVALLPVLCVLWVALTPARPVWGHLVSTVLPGYLLNTLTLMAGVAVGTAVVGIATAWLVSRHEFPGRGVLSWALVLPLAFPAYVVAFLYTDLLEYAGIVQRTLRAMTGWQTLADYWFPEIRSPGGAIFVLTLTLYPYVYLLGRAAFSSQSASLMEAARSLGMGPVRAFLAVGLPMARPALAVGISLALMETLNDFGTISYFAVNTLTLGVYQVWLGMGNAPAAAQIALTIVALAVALLAVERLSRRGRRFALSGRQQAAGRTRLPPSQAIWAMVACLVPVLLGFLLPAVNLVVLAAGWIGTMGDARFLSAAAHSLLLSGTAALVTVIVGVLLAYGTRISGLRSVTVLARLASVGYAVPGVVLALGVMVAFTTFDNAVDAWSRQALGLSTGLLLSGSGFILVFAYTVRFLAVAHGAAESGLARIRPTMEDAARTLGDPPLKVLTRLHLPLLRGYLIAGAALVFVDSMKELPATLMLQPFNFETVATLTYQYAKDELFAQAAPGALLIVVAGLVPVLLLNRGLGGDGVME